MADVDIHCNVIKCRRPLSIETQACVTSCSHIFCLDCSKKIFSKALVCPACNTALSEESDDIILTQLNPTEEYKSSVLAGLKPDIILDICSRAIAFYEYQSSQELNFRSILQRNTEEKYNSLKGQFDMVTRDLNHIIKVEKEKQKAIINDYELEKKKSQQMYIKLEDKSKQFQKLQVMYEKLKRKSMAPNIQESLMNSPMIRAGSSPSSRGNNLMRFNNNNQPQQIVDKSDDIISILGRSSAVARSVFIPPQPPQSPAQHYYNNNAAQPPSPRAPSPRKSRIPSPVKSIFSVRSSHRRHYHRSNNDILLQQQQPMTPTASRNNHHKSPRQHYNNNVKLEP